MNFTTYHSSCYRIETRTSKNSDELRAIEKAYVAVTYSVFLFFKTIPKVLW